MDQYFERAWFLGFCLIFILLAMGAEAATACRHEVAQSLKTGLRFSGGLYRLLELTVICFE